MVVEKGQQILVSSSSSDNFQSRKQQYICGVIATIGGLICGTVLGWSSPVEVKLKNGEYGFPISSDDFSWIGGCMPLGAIVGCLLTAILIDLMGRKSLILCLVLPCIIGWSSIIWAQTVLMFCVGRFLTGMAVGGYCIVVPMFTAEISEKEIRGTLGTYFQLQITIGILASYIIGSYVSVFKLTVALGIIPIFYALLMSTLPESPLYYLKIGDRHGAEIALKHLRSSETDVTLELKLMQENVEKDETEKVSVIHAFTTKAAKRGLIIGLGVMFLQQFSGVNAVIFYSSSIFKDSGTELDSNMCTIILGAVSVIATWIATLVVDKLGRRIMLLFSVCSMAFFTFLLASYYFLKTMPTDDISTSSKTLISMLDWIPVTSLSGFIIVFSLGFGPIPWMLMGEIFPSGIKGAASSVACFFNWFCVFVITKFFANIVAEFGIGKTFQFFTVCSLLGIFFVYFFVPETKGKTLSKIQEMLGGQEDKDLQPPSNHSSPKQEVINEFSAKIRL